MNSKHKFLLFLYFFLINFMVFAQPTDEDNNNDLEGNDPPAAPINNTVFLLGVFGVIYVYNKIKKVSVEKY